MDHRGAGERQKVEMWPSLIHLILAVPSQEPGELEPSGGWGHKLTTRAHHRTDGI